MAWVQRSETWQLQKLSGEQWKTIKLQQRFKIEAHNVFTEKVKKIPLSQNGDRELQMFDWIIWYQYDKGAGRIAKT